MGTNNRQRRAAKQRKRARARAGRPTAPGPAGSAYGDTWTTFEAAMLARDQVTAAVGATIDDSKAARTHAESLVRQDRQVPLRFVAEALNEMLSTLVSTAVHGGWTPADLDQVVRRRAGVGGPPLLSARLAAEAARYRPDEVDPAWRAELDALDALGAPGPGDLRTVTGLASALLLTAVLAILPEVASTLPAPGSAPAPRRHEGHSENKQLAKVRALLAKAESTEYDEEAEALSAKAQDLITRHSLERLLTAPSGRDDGPAAEVRRLWIDPPYLVGKATLIDQVAVANHCRSVLSEELGFITVMGEPADLDAVELLSTSLLMQAHTAMMRHGRHVDRTGTSRTRSFRQSFLVAYALRIGDRLRETNVAVAHEVDPTESLLPVLRDHDRRVDDVFAELFPNVVTRGAEVSNGLGWAAGTAAADLALLDTNPKLSPAAT